MYEKRTFTWCNIVLATLKEWHIKWRTCCFCCHCSVLWVLPAAGVKWRAHSWSRLSRSWDASETCRAAILSSTRCSRRGTSRLQLTQSITDSGRCFISPELRYQPPGLKLLAGTCGLTRFLKNNDAGHIQQLCKWSSVAGSKTTRREQSPAHTEPLRQPITVAVRRGRHVHLLQHQPTAADELIICASQLLLFDKCSFKSSNSKKQLDWLGQVSSLDVWTSRFCRLYDNS